MTASVTNPFLNIFPKTPLPRIFETRGDIEVLALVGDEMAKLTGDKRFSDSWKFVKEKKVEVYLQRVLDASANTKGYRIEELEAKAKDGVPSIVMSRTNPKCVGYEQVTDSRPWYTKSRPPRVLPRGARVHRGRREPPRPPRADRLDVLRAERDRRPEARGDPARGARGVRRREGRPLLRGAPGPQRREDVGGDEEDRRTRSRRRATSSSSTRRSTGTARTRSRSTPTWSRCSSGRSATSTGTTSGRRS